LDEEGLENWRYGSVGRAGASAEHIAAVESRAPRAKEVAFDRGAAVSGGSSSSEASRPMTYASPEEELQALSELFSQKFNIPSTP
ncbi:unnamed protein product, partial [Polarella glacialis]